MKFVFRSPKLSFSDNIFLLSFDKVIGKATLPLRKENHYITQTSLLQTVWMSLILWLLLVAVLLTAVVYAIYMLQSIETAQGNDLRTTLLDSLFMVFCATCQQSASSIPENFTAQIISVVCFMALMFLYIWFLYKFKALPQTLP